MLDPADFAEEIEIARQRAQLKTDLNAGRIQKPAFEQKMRELDLAEAKL